jgi:ornithine cyclodeaminase/alanine dehydrogenase
MTAKRETLLLSASDVTSLLTVSDCIAAVEAGLIALGEGRIPPPELLSLHSELGGLHVKAAVWMNGSHYFVAKANANFPSNPKTYGLPTIQGVIILCDANTGELLALIDSIEITALRTGAATAVAARKLARADSRVLTVCGCGRQGQVQLQSVLQVLPIESVFAYDVDPAAAHRFAENNQRLNVGAIEDVQEAIRKSDVVVTCTPARKFFVRSRDVRPGTFIAAVGADNEHKQEIDPRLFVKNKVVVDSITQCLKIGDLHHAVAEGFASAASVYAELADVIAGKAVGRNSQDEITIFDSTGIAVEDAAAAALVFEKATHTGVGSNFSF